MSGSQPVHESSRTALPIHWMPRTVEVWKRLNQAEVIPPILGALVTEITGKDLCYPDGAPPSS